MRPLSAHCHLGLGELYRKVGKPDQARAELAAAVELYRTMEMRFGLSRAEAALALVVQWCLVVLAAYFVETKPQFFVVAVVAGTAPGAVQAASRAFMAALIPAGQAAELFGFYALCGKTAAIFGPMTFGLASWLSGGNQRIAILAVGIMFVIGLAVLSGVKAGGPTVYPLADTSPASPKGGMLGSG